MQPKRLSNSQSKQFTWLRDYQPTINQDRLYKELLRAIFHNHTEASSPPFVFWFFIPFPQLGLSLEGDIERSCVSSRILQKRGKEDTALQGFIAAF